MTHSNISKIITVTALSVFVGACASMVQISGQKGGRGIAVTKSTVITPTTAKKVRPRIPRHCYTNQPGCAGTAYFQLAYDANCTIWYDDGTRGHSNFRIYANQPHPEPTRYYDTHACLDARYGRSPDYNGNRYYLWVP